MKEFDTYAKLKFELVVVDFPENKPQTEAQKRHNQEVKEKYAIEGFPTLLVLDGDGRKLGSIVGYDGKGLKSVTKQLNEIVDKKK